MFLVTEITIEKAKTFKEIPDVSQIGFGKYFTLHMFEMDYNPEEGWHNPRVEPYRD